MNRIPSRSTSTAWPFDYRDGVFRRERAPADAEPAIFPVEIRRSMEPSSGWGSDAHVWSKDVTGSESSTTTPSGMRAIRAANDFIDVTRPDPWRGRALR